MASSLLEVIAIFVPLAGAFGLPFLGRISSRSRNLGALGLILVSLGCSLALVPGALSGGIARFNLLGPLGISFSLSADALAVFMALVSSLIGAVIILFSFDYISRYEHQDEYYLMALLFLGSMLGLIFSANLVFLFVFWEITSIASWRLIGFYRAKNDVLKADKAFLVTAFGALVMLVGILGVCGLTGSFDLQAMKGRALPLTLSSLLLVGMLSKSATFPFQTWLPDAGVAPAPVTALLHAAVLVNIGVYVFERLYLATFAFDATLRTAVTAIAAASALVTPEPRSWTPK
jgi:NADH:ubiquinone oxidoreductase subunit 5 (subunit L)/multisubunit Na+/H+ antiporter MnhA subunit